MGVDAEDWQRQVKVNVSSVGQIPVDITQQTLSKILTTPDLRSATWERSAIAAASQAIAATTEVSIGSDTTSGVGFAFRMKADDPDLEFRIRVDGSQILYGDIGGVWTKWGGLHYEETMQTLVTIYDTANDEYAIVRDWGFNYPFTTSVELRVYNPGAVLKNVNNIVLAYLTPV